MIGPIMQEVEYIDIDANGTTPTAEAAIPGLNVDDLNEEQRRAYDIVIWHAEQTRAGVVGLPPLRMMISGEGGTGKSRVIQTITEAFEKMGMKVGLAKGAYTGIAASVIDGKALHNLCQLLVRKRKDGKEMSDKAKRALQEFWSKKQYLIIDEISMVSKTVFANILRNIDIGRAHLDSIGRLFGGLNIILVGDFHQFPPVAGEALYKQPSARSDNLEAALGQELYMEFTTIVMLRKQMRVVDGGWRDFLTELRAGDVSSKSLDMLRGLMIGRRGGGSDLKSTPWKSASLVTPRHGVGHKWNSAALRDFCAREKKTLYVCPAGYVVGKTGEAPGLYERWAMEVRIQSKRPEEKSDLPDELELAIGARVMVTENINTELDIANGSRGEIVDIVLGPNEPCLQVTNGIWKLQHPPLYILVKMQRTKTEGLDGLEERVIPVQPAQRAMYINVYEPMTRKTRRKTVNRR